MKIFFTIEVWILISVIIALVIFVINYLEYKKEKKLVVNGREIVWSIIAVLAGPITIIFILIYLVACGADWLFSLDWWTKKKVLVEKKDKEDNSKRTPENENPSGGEGIGFGTDA
jgi:hypothetical protein